MRIALLWPQKRRIRLRQRTELLKSQTSFLHVLLYLGWARSVFSIGLSGGLAPDLRPSNQRTEELDANKRSDGKMTKLMICR